MTDMKIPTCSQFKKVTLITDPKNPEMDLLDKITSLGETVYRQECSDGFVYLIDISSDSEIEVPSTLE